MIINLNKDNEYRMHILSWLNNEVYGPVWVLFQSDGWDTFFMWFAQFERTLVRG